MTIARREDGFTLVEMVLGAGLALILMSAGLLTLERAFTISMQVTERVDSSQRARQAMDTMTRQLRSAVCPDPLTSSLIGGTNDSVTFFVDLSDGSSPVAKHVLSYDATDRTIEEARYNGVGAAPNTTWPTNPTATRVLLENVVRNGSTPVFRFNAFGTATPPTPSVVLATPLNAAGVASASRITISFIARESRSATTSAFSTPLQDQIDLRSADPNQPKPAPQCT